MRKMEKEEKKPQNLKRKLMSALAMLLVATTLMTTTSYAWFVLSTAPEVTGIETQVGANGSLEIALLNTETRTDMSLIRSGLGDSIVAGNLAANYAWGNLVDLSYVDYGLGEILLLPTRLNYTGSAEVGYTVDPSGLLAVPTYGYDGRVVDLTDDTVSAIYQDNEFAFISGVQDYGVRAIGSSDALSVQGSSLANAKGNIPTYSKSAKANAQAVLAENGEAIFNIMLAHLQDATATYGDADRDALYAMLSDLEKSINDIEAALRQGLVAYAASQIGEEDTFVLVKDQILDTENELTDMVSAVDGVPAEFASWVQELDRMQNDLFAAMNACTALTGGTYTWDQIRGVLNYVMDVESVYIGENLFANVDTNAIMDAVLAGQEIVMTLAPGSGIFADISNFAGNYSTSMTVMGMANILITTASAVDPVYLTALATGVSTLEAADGGEEAAALPLTATYGYALDLAFRCNAAEPDLVLQTTPEQRVYVDSEAASTQGGGSYMEFTSTDDSLTLEQRLKLMDAVRVGFVDDQGELLGVAKLNILNRIVENGAINAPLYLYEYSFSEEDGAMIMGERKLEDNLITPLQQNVAKAITVVVWLDGDLVDNTMVSATEAASLSGVLNLQFATSAELVPAADGTLLGYTPDASGLEAALAMFADEFVAGQGTNTNESWNAFAAAYNRAVAVSENENPSAIEINNAVKSLTETANALEAVSKDAINMKIAQLREMMGTIPGEVASYVIENADGTYSAAGAQDHTQEEHDSWNIVGQIDRVDYNNNLNDEGNDIYTTKYTDESWNTLANALYQAEAVARSENATEDQINAAMTAIENAEKALTRQVFFKPYEYRGAIYYEAICDAENADTYGKWYDNTFKRIVSDLTIMNLDAYAQEVNIVTMGQETYVASDAGYITPDIAFLEEVFPELRGVEVKGVNWNEVDENLFTELMNQNHYSKLSELVTMADTDPVLNHAMSAECAAARDAASELMTQWANGQEVTADGAENAIQSLNDVIIELYDTNLKQMESENIYMTDNQRILLTAAVNSAKAVTGYETDAELADLRSSAQTAEGLLASETAVLQTEANDALTGLNSQLKAAGATEVTEYNTLTHKLPEGFDAEDIVYSVDFPGIHLKLTGNSGTTTIGAQVLTQDGVVVSVSKEVTVYDRADGVKLLRAGTEIDSLSLTVGGTADLTAQLFYEEGGVNTGDKSLEQILEEEVKSYKWASAATDVATVAGKESGTATITSVTAGITTISVSVETKAGNVYTLEIPVTVSE